MMDHQPRELQTLIRILSFIRLQFYRRFYTTNEIGEECKSKASHTVSKMHERYVVLFLRVTSDSNAKCKSASKSQYSQAWALLMREQRTLKIIALFPIYSSSRRIRNSHEFVP